MSILDFLRGEWTPQLAERLGKPLGLAPQVAQQTLGAVWPLQLDALITHAQHPAGAQQLLDLAASVPSGSPDDLLERPGSLSDLQKLGAGTAPTLLGRNEATITQQVSALPGAPSAAATEQLGRLSLPLLLGLLLQYARSHSLGAAELADALHLARPQLAALLPSALAPLIGQFAAPSQDLRPAAAPTPQSEERRRGAGWLWAIPLALLLLVGGCYLAQQNRAAQPPTAQPTSAAGEATGPLSVSDPMSGATLPAAAFSMRGSGPVGQQLTILEGGSSVGTATVAGDGTWSADLPAPSSGEHTYTVQDSSGHSTELQVTVSGGTDAASSDTTSSGTPDASGNYSITEPSGSVPAGTFDLKGSAPAGESLEVFEDGASLGNVTGDESGSWTFNVPSPAAGAHTYEVRGAGGRASALIKVGADTASNAACTQAFTVSLQDGQSVTAPFRFGGQGQSSGYNVTVKRGERTIGTKTLPVSGSCGWSYTSNPGKGEITYVVRSGQDLSAAPLQTMTLTVQ